MTPPCLLDRDGEQRSLLAPRSSDPLRDAGHTSPKVVRFSNGERGTVRKRSGRPLRDSPRSGILWSGKNRKQIRLLYFLNAIFDGNVKRSSLLDLHCDGTLA